MDSSLLKPLENVTNYDGDLLEGALKSWFATHNAPETKTVCNVTCCLSDDGSHVCFINYNYSDYSNITVPSDVELAVRWTYTTIVFMFGFFGNLAIIHILLTNRLLLKASVNKFILNMSIADFILTCAGPILFTIRDVSSPFWPLGAAWCHLEGYIQEMMMMVSAYSLTVISFDRMFGIIRPFYRHLDFKRSVIAIACIWIFSAILVLPFAFNRIYTVRQWADLTEKICRENGKMMVWWPISCVVLIWIPCFAMIVCYSVIIFNFNKYHRQFSGRTKNGRPNIPEHPIVMYNKRRVVRMMFIIVIVFLVSWMPLQIFVVTKRIFFNEDDQLKPEYEQMYNNFLTIANYMVYLNAAIDPIIYALKHENFKRAAKLTYGWLFTKPPSFVLTRGTGNRRFMWSTRTDFSSRKPQSQSKSRGPSQKIKNLEKSISEEKKSEEKVNGNSNSSNSASSTKKKRTLFSFGRSRSPQMDYDSDSNNNITSASSESCPNSPSKSVAFKL